MNLAVALIRLDELTQGHPLRDVPPSDLTRVLEELTRKQSPATVRGWAACVKAFYTWANADELPKPVRLALRRRDRDEFHDVATISEAERDALLTAAGDGCRRPDAARRQALVWALWDSGFRISELLSLRVQDVEFGADGGATLRLNPDAPNLKTGARAIYVVECVGALRLWLSLHPRGTDPSALVFSARSDGLTPLYPTTANNVLRALAQKAGVRHVNPHLFRHTRATRAARAGWNEPQLRAYFGWTAASNMAARYVHLSQRDMEERVRQDANVDPLGVLVREDPKKALAEAITTSNMDLLRQLKEGGFLKA